MKRDIIKPILGQIYVLIISSTLLYSCEEVIEIDLNDSSPQLAIDASILQNQPATVTISYTSSYFSDEKPVYETNAIVTISDQLGNIETLQQLDNGVYAGQRLTGRVGVEYELSVSVGDDTYIGRSKLMTPTEIIRLDYSKFDRFGSSHGSDEYTLDIVLKNNPQEDNYFLIKYYLNDKDKEETYSVWSHEFFSKDDTIQFSPMHFLFTKDDVVTVRAYSIDEGTYDYYSQLDEIIDYQGATTPFNPSSNMGTEVLGYFRAWSYDEKSIQVEEE
ncbi:DUF4249 domain-containing protein [Carboxylicivirga taeanensis]|uniref:DUF4249 domain-containing protein n=1 Tax=Carboxylicivirga taeanensis TaxID=1416875 RepID=UPI003F6E28B7